MQSLPSRERGLKCKQYHQLRILLCVAPLAGAWIEMIEAIKDHSYDNVAPLAGAWIEIRCTWNQSRDQRSRSPRGSVD